MNTTFYLDESGHSGDMVNSGDNFDFNSQPYFVLAAVGLSDEAAHATHVAKLRTLHRIPKGGACKNFCVNGHLAGDCHAPRSDDGRSKESSTQRVAGQPAG
ncbi:DUF3800 domain-containing protein [Dechloromonas sp. ZY10]|uniref:DUF3800 domain-containing protein n=1 Tax=Dechloromonas aquae TaxID=2664436 RepID=UPI003527708F